MKYYILYNGGKIYYSDKGAGDPIILIHGHLENSDIWNDFAKRLSDKFRIISIDLPGHGLSKVYSDTHTMDFMAGAVKGLMDSLHLKRAFVTGHSLGGYVTLAFLDKYPDMLSGYCLFHSHPFADTRETQLKRESEIKIVRSGKKYLLYPMSISMMFANENIESMHDALQRSKDIASTIRDEGIVAALNGMIVRPSRLTVMENGKVPGLWILGRKDNHIQCDSIQSRVRLPGNMKVVVLENSGHMGFVEEKDLSVDVITDFVKTLK